MSAVPPIPDELLSPAARRLRSSFSSAPAPVAEPSALSSFGSGVVRGLYYQPRIAFNEWTFDHDEAVKVAQEADRYFPSSGYSGAAGNAIGSILPAAAVLVGSALAAPATGGGSVVAGLGYTGMALAGYQAATATGMRLHELNNYEQVTGKPMGAVGKYTDALGHGAMAYLTEKFMGVGGTMTGLGGLGQKVGPTAAREIGKAWLARKATPAAMGELARVVGRHLGPAVASGMMREGFQEGLEQVGDNILSQLAGAKPEALTQGVAESVFGGAVAGGLVGPTHAGFDAYGQYRNTPPTPPPSTGLSVMPKGPDFSMGSDPSVFEAMDHYRVPRVPLRVEGPAQDAIQMPPVAPDGYLDAVYQMPPTPSAPQQRLEGPNYLDTEARNIVHRKGPSVVYADPAPATDVVPYREPGLPSAKRNGPTTWPASAEPTGVSVKSRQLSETNEPDIGIFAAMDEFGLNRRVGGQSYLNLPGFVDAEATNVVRSPVPSDPTRISKASDPKRLGFTPEPPKPAPAPVRPTLSEQFEADDKQPAAPPPKAKKKPAKAAPPPPAASTPPTPAKPAPVAKDAPQAPQAKAEAKPAPPAAEPDIMRAGNQKYYDDNLPTAKQKQLIREDVAVAGAQLGKKPQRVIDDLVKHGSEPQDAFEAVRYGYTRVKGKPPNIFMPKPPSVPEVGADIRVMGKDTKLFSAALDDNGVSYELYRDKAGGGGSVRVHDADSGKNVSLKQYKSFDQAKAEYRKLLAKAEGKPAAKVEPEAKPQVAEPVVAPQASPPEELRSFYEPNGNMIRGGDAVTKILKPASDDDVRTVHRESAGYPGTARRVIGDAASAELRRRGIDPGAAHAANVKAKEEADKSKQVDAIRARIRDMRESQAGAKPPQAKYLDKLIAEKQAELDALVPPTPMDAAVAAKESLDKAVSAAKGQKLTRDNLDEQVRLEDAAEKAKADLDAAKAKLGRKPKKAAATEKAKPKPEEPVTSPDAPVVEPGVHIESARGLKPGEYGGNVIAADSGFVGSQTFIIDKKAVIDKKMAKMLAKASTGKIVGADLAGDMFRKSVTNAELANHEMEYGRLMVGEDGDQTVLLRGGDVLAVVDADVLKTVQQSVGGFDKILAKDASSPVVFYRGDKAVAIAQPKSTKKLDAVAYGIEFLKPKITVLDAKPVDTTPVPKVENKGSYDPSLAPRHLPRTIGGSRNLLEWLVKLFQTDADFKKNPAAVFEDGKLVVRDGATYRLEPDVFGYNGDLKPGQKVTFHLEAIQQEIKMRREGTAGVSRENTQTNIDSDINDNPGEKGDDGKPFKECK